MTADAAALSAVLADGDLALEPLAERHRVALKAACAEDLAIWPIYGLSYDPDHFDANFNILAAGGAKLGFAIMHDGVLVGMSAYLAGVTGAPLTSAVIAMELSDNQDMVIPIMAACLLARAMASLFCPTPVYRDFAERMVQDYERQQIPHAKVVVTGAGGTNEEPDDPAPVGRTSAFDEPAAPADTSPTNKP